MVHDRAGCHDNYFLDSGLHYLTTYYYRVVAVSSAGSSPASSIVSALTGAQPDVLAARSLVMTLTRRASFSGPVATFTDANAATTAASFIATINWGERRVRAGHGQRQGRIFHHQRQAHVLDRQGFSRCR